MTETNSIKIGGILLAAGGSARMGLPKQLLEFEGNTLMRRAAESLAATDCDPKVVVLGAEAERCQAELGDLDLNIFINRDWEHGMSSSIKAGLRCLLDVEPAASAVIITLCDLPLVTAEVIERFIAEYRSVRPNVIAAEYNGVCGVPALFSCDMFDEIFRLEGDKGARDLIRHAGVVVRINVPEAAFDVDSPDDLIRVREGSR